MKKIKPKHISWALGVLVVGACLLGSYLWNEDESAPSSQEETQLSLPEARESDRVQKDSPQEEGYIKVTTTSVELVTE